MEKKKINKRIQEEDKVIQTLGNKIVKKMVNK